MRPVPGLPGLLGHPLAPTRAIVWLPGPRNCGPDLLYLHLHLHLFLRLRLWPCFQPLIGLSGLGLDALAVFSWQAGGLVGWLAQSGCRLQPASAAPPGKVVGRFSTKGAIQWVSASLLLMS